MDTVIKDLGYDEGENDRLTRIRNRFNVMSFACSIGHKGCVNHAIETFNKRDTERYE